MMDREVWRATVHGVARVGYDWATQLNWTCKSIMVRGGCEKAFYKQQPRKQKDSVPNATELFTKSWSKNDSGVCRWEMEWPKDRHAGREPQKWEKQRGRLVSPWKHSGDSVLVTERRSFRASRQVWHPPSLFTVWASESASVKWN